MSNFCAGDEVIIESNDSNYNKEFEDNPYKIHGISPESNQRGIVQSVGINRVLVRYDVGFKTMCLSFPKNGVRIVKSESLNKFDNIIQNLMDKFLSLFEGGTTKSYKRIGIYDANGIPTDTGVKMFVKYILDGKSDLVTAFQSDVVTKLVADLDSTKK